MVIFKSELSGSLLQSNVNGRSYWNYNGWASEPLMIPLFLAFSIATVREHSHDDVNWYVQKSIYHFVPPLSHTYMYVYMYITCNYNNSATYTFLEYFHVHVPVTTPPPPFVHANIWAKVGSRLIRGIITFPWDDHLIPTVECHVGTRSLYFLLFASCAL